MSKSVSPGHENSILRTCVSFMINTLQDGPFRGYSSMRRAKWSLLRKIFHAYSTMIKFGTVIPYLRKTQKIYKSRDTSLDFC